MNVTGIITSYNREAEIVEQAIQSMLNQTYPIMEVIVIDDNPNGSWFSSELFKMCCKYSLVKYIKQDGNKGACAARNLGIKNANGEIIGFLDDDDSWLPKKLEKQLKPFEDKEIGMVSCCGFLRNSNSNNLSEYFNINQFKKNITYYDLLKRDYIGTTSQPLIRKSVFEAVGGFWEEQPARQDYEMWIRISQKYKIACIKDKLFVHVIHEGEQISKNKSKSHIGYTNILIRYLADYKRHPFAMRKIISNIWHTRECTRLKEILFLAEIVYGSKLKKLVTIIEGK